MVWKVQVFEDRVLEKAARDLLSQRMQTHATDSAAIWARVQDVSQPKLPGGVTMRSQVFGLDCSADKLRSSHSI